MGVSSDGILAFGVDLGEPDEFDELNLPWRSSDDEDEDDPEDDFGAWYLGLYGLSSAPLWDAYYEWAATPEGEAIASHERVAAYEALNPDWDRALDEFHAQARDLEKTAPIELVTHCSYDYPMLIVAVAGTVSRAYRGSPVVLGGLEVDPIDLASAQGFCEAHGIPFESPGWILTSVYG